MTVQDLDRTPFEQGWADWRRQHEAALADDHGFLAITSLNWLTAEPQRFPDAPGTWSTGADGVTVELGDAEELVIAGTPVTGRYAFGPIPERGGVTAPPTSGAATCRVRLAGYVVTPEVASVNRMLRLPGA